MRRTRTQEPCAYCRRRTQSNPPFDTSQDSGRTKDRGHSGNQDRAGSEISRQPQAETSVTAHGLAAGDENSYSTTGECRRLVRLGLWPLAGCDFDDSEERDCRPDESRNPRGPSDRCARVPAIGYDIRLDTAIIATLMACGLRSREHLEVVLVAARLPTACAEALAWKPGDLRVYPMDLPSFRYEGDADALS